MSDTPTTGPTVTIPTAELAQLEHLVEVLEEAATDAHRLLAAEDTGWKSLTDDGSAISREAIRDIAKLGRVMSIHDPLIRRGVNLRVSYVWGQGVSVQADTGENRDGDQDVNAIVQAFWDDQETTFSGAQACEERERALATDGNVFLSLPTDPLYGRVQVRVIPDAQVVDILTDPEDADTPWLYKRTWNQTSAQTGSDKTGRLVTHTITQSRTAWYPALDYRPNRRPRTLDGYPIEWDKPVLHARVNRPSGSKWGTPDLTAALPWARGYASGLQDWAKLIKALSAFAFRATAKDGKGAAQVRTRLSSADPEGIGGVALVREGQTFEAIGKTGATIDSRSFMPLAAQVAAALEVPATMLTSDPGVTGARATAETLDQPLRLTIKMRRDLNATVLHRILDHVIDSAIKAPRGPLKGTVRIDPATGHEAIVLAGDQKRGIDIDWPALEDVDLPTLIKAIVEADSVGYLPPEIIVRLLLIALDVDNPDEILDGLLDDDGNFILPQDSADARSALAGVGAGRFDDGQG